MFKKVAQIAVTFCLLVAGYLGYSRGFALVAAQLGAGRSFDGSVPFPIMEQKSSKRAGELARESFGPDHWAARPDQLKMQFYDAARGSYLYAQNYERLNDGKRFRVWPFAMISSGKEGQARKTVTSDEAIIDLSQPFGLVRVGGEPSRVVHARLNGHVQIRDDKATRDRADDLVVLLPTYVEYDEKTLQITSDNTVNLTDRDMTMTGLGLMIQLRRKPAPRPSTTDDGAGAGQAGSGFEAETVFIHKNPDITIKDVTPGGVLVGTSRPNAQGRTPLRATADGEMRIDLPRPHPVVEVGPPDLNRAPDPTFVRFQRNVRVVRGTTTPDQLNSDTLDLTFLPEPKAPVAPGAVAAPTPDKKPAATATATATASPPAGGPLTELKLRKAVAKGHAVWVQSESQGLKARCLELTYDKHVEEGTPDKTYLNGGLTKKLWVEKVDLVAEGPKAGSIKSVRVIRAMDTTIFDYGVGGTSRVISRGPGTMEERPLRNASIERTVWWEDDMELRTWRDIPAPAPAPLVGAEKPAPGPLRRLVTLTGPSKLVDHKGGSTLDAREKIVAEFAAEPGAKSSPNGEEGTEIKWLDAFKDVHLTTTGRTLTARDQLKAKFVHPEPSAFAPPPAALAAAGPVPAQGPAPLVVAAAGEAPLIDSRPEPKPAEVEPAVDGRANFIWATIVQGGGNPKGDLKDAQLRGAVMVHQDAAPGESFPKDLTGEALDLTSQGKGLMNFVVYAEDPQAAETRAKLAARETRVGPGGKARVVAKPRSSLGNALARIDFDGRTVEGPRLGLSQKDDYAWCQGAGHLVQLAERGLLDDKGLAPTKDKKKKEPGGPNTLDKLVITWNDEMRFFGRSRDLKGRDAAKVEFRGASEEVRTPNGSTTFRRGVEARMEDSAIFADAMDVYMDRIIAFDKVGKKPPTPAAPVVAGANPDDVAPATEPDAQIAMMDCRGQAGSGAGRPYHGVDITSRKRFEDTGLIKEKYRIQHVHVVYDKRTGDFEAPGAGTVFLYQGQPAKAPANPVAAATVVPVAAIGRGGRLDPSAALRPQPPLKLTKVQFTEGMRGRFGMSKDQAETEPRTSEFVGDVQAATAVVSGAGADIDFDHPPVDNVFLTSDILRIRSVPPPLGTKAPARSWLFADGNAQARTVDRTVQGDRITYDSGSDNIYVYSDNDKGIVIVEQKSTGQKPSELRGRSGRYNNRTKESTVDNPNSIQIFDLKTGARPKPFFPDTGGSPKPGDPFKIQRTPLQRPARNSIERNSFTGH